MSKGIFITGTDTGVGKTIVSAAIIRALMNKGIKVGAMKPLETGCKKSAVKEEKEILIPSDGMFLIEMAEMDDSIDMVTPIRFEQPLAPMVASEIEFGVMSYEFGAKGLKKVFDAYEELSKKYDFMVVEGVGGLLVPIAKGQRAKGKRQAAYFVSDLIKDLKLPVIIVARPGLGTVNHTLLTVNHALREGIEVLGVIINYSRPPENDIAEKTNPDALRQLCPVPVIDVIPYIEKIGVTYIENISQTLKFTMFEQLQKIFTLP
ncbi:dethiobiotin synthase [hot springs metagenome]|uniref:Dethiobiotin synthase n=1 Tax=hot springs metagenome TaxID=433727 RepID=A0A5J4KXB3_9ZZZZ